jgi:hypothetical protein
MVLSDEQEAVFARLAAMRPDTEVTSMVNIFEQKGIEKGIERGIAEGLLAGQRRSLLAQMRSKLGELPEEVTARIQGISDPERLDALLMAILKADTLEEMTALM